MIGNLLDGQGLAYIFLELFAITALFIGGKVRDTQKSFTWTAPIALMVVLGAEYWANLESLLGYSFFFCVLFWWGVALCLVMYATPLVWEPENGFGNWLKSFWRWLLSPQWSSFFFWTFGWCFLAALVAASNCYSEEAETDLANQIAISAAALAVLFPIVILILEIGSKNEPELIPRYEIFLHYSWSVPISIFLCLSVIYLGSGVDSRLGDWLPALTIFAALVLLYRTLRISFFDQLQTNEEIAILGDHQRSLDRYLREITQGSNSAFLDMSMGLVMKMDELPKIPIHASRAGYVNAIDFEKLKKINDKIQKLWPQNEENTNWIYLSVENKDRLKQGDPLLTAYLPEGWNPQFGEKEALQKQLEVAIKIKPGAPPTPQLLRSLERLLRESLREQQVVLISDLEPTVLSLIEKASFENYQYFPGVWEEPYLDYRDLIFDYLRKAHFHVLDRAQPDLPASAPLMHLHFSVVRMLVFEKQCFSALDGMTKLFSTQAWFLLKKEVGTFEGLDLVSRQIDRVLTLLWGIGSRLKNEPPSKQAEGKLSIGLSKLFNALQDIGFYALKFQSQSAFNKVIDGLEGLGSSADLGLAERTQESLIGLGQIYLQKAYQKFQEQKTIVSTETSPELASPIPPQFAKEFLQIVALLSADVATVILPNRGNRVSIGRWENWITWEEHQEKAFTPHYPTFVNLLQTIVLVHRPPWGLDEQTKVRIEADPEWFRDLCTAGNRDVRSILEKGSPVAGDWPWLQKLLNNSNKEQAIAWLKECYQCSNSKYQENVKNADITQPLAELNQKIRALYPASFRFEQILSKFPLIQEQRGLRIHYGIRVPKGYFADQDTHHGSLDELFGTGLAVREEATLLNQIKASAERLGTLNSIGYLLERVKGLAWERPTLLTNAGFHQKRAFFQGPGCAGFDLKPGDNQLLGTCSTPSGTEIKVYFVGVDAGQAEALAFDASKVSVNRTWTGPKEKFPELQSRPDDSRTGDSQLILSVEYALEVKITPHQPFHFLLPVEDV